MLGVLGRFLELRNAQWADRDSLLRIRQEKLRAVLRSARSTPHYCRLMGGLSLEELESDISLLPPTMKGQVQGNEKSFLAAGAEGKALYPVETSGSTGTPLRLHLDQDSADQRTASLGLVQTEFGRTPFDLFAEISVRPCHTLPLLPALGLFRKLPLSVFDDESRNLELLRRGRPDILGWYPSTLAVLARLNMASGPRLKLKSVFCGAETLSAGRRKLLGESFSCRVFQQYGCVEFGTLAFECPEERLHVCAPSCLLEIVDARGRPKKSGTGDILVTSLSNLAMPLLRYRIGDRGSWGNDCACGRGLPVLKSLEGRDNDFIILPSGRERSPVSFDILEGVHGVLAYQLVQERPDHFLFRLVPAQSGFPEESRLEVRKRILAACLGERVSVEFEELPRLEKAGGKLRTVVSKAGRRG
jgi:phenylacetate-CoA ligase